MNIKIFFNDIELNPYSNKNNIELTKNDLLALINFFDFSNFSYINDSVILSFVFVLSDKEVSIFQVEKNKKDKRVYYYLEFKQKELLDSDVSEFFKNEYYLEFYPKNFKNIFLSLKNYNQFQEKYFLEPSIASSQNISLLEKEIQDMLFVQDNKFKDYEIPKVKRYREILDRLSEIQELLSSNSNLSNANTNNNKNIQSNDKKYLNIDSIESIKLSVDEEFKKIQEILNKQELYLNSIQNIERDLKNLLHIENQTFFDVASIYLQSKKNKLNQISQTLKKVTKNFFDKDLFISTQSEVEIKVNFQFFVLFLSFFQIFLGLVTFYFSRNIFAIFASLIALIIYNFSLFVLKKNKEKKYKNKNNNFVDYYSNGYKTIINYIDKSNDKVFLLISWYKTFQDELKKINESIQYVIGNKTLIQVKSNLAILNKIKFFIDEFKADEENNKQYTTKQLTDEDITNLKKEESSLKIEKENIEFDVFKIDIKEENNINQKVQQLKNIKKKLSLSANLKLKNLPLFLVLPIEILNTKTSENPINQIKNIVAKMENLYNDKKIFLLYIK